MVKEKVIIFDFDGTLFKTEKLALYAFNQTFERLKREGYKIDISITDENLVSIIGLTLNEIWDRFIPGSNQEIINKASAYLLNYELNGAKKGIGELYSGVEDGLKKLGNLGYKLYIASNGQKEYVDGLLEILNIKDFFVAVYTAGEYSTAKKDDLVSLLLKNHNISHAIMVGDRSSDVSAGFTNNLFTIGCSFGFSTLDELAGSDEIINNFSQLIDFVVNQ